MTTIPDAELIAALDRQARIEAMPAYTGPTLSAKARNRLTELTADKAQLTAQNAELKAALEWRSIETAPRDGTIIWVYQPPTTLYPYGWQYECEWNGAQWYHGFGDAFPDAKPTYWQPLPEPPARRTLEDKP